MTKLIQLFNEQNAFIMEGLSVSRGDLLSKIFLLAAGLSGSKYQKVNIYCEDIYSFSICFFACVLCKKEVTVFSNDKSSVWLSDSNELWLTSTTWQEYLADSPSGALEEGISPDARINFFTSGSTGEAKKVAKTFLNLYSEAEELDAFFTEGLSKCSVISSVSHNHIYGFLFSLLWPAAAKRSIIAKTCVYQEDLAPLGAGGDFIFISSPAFLKRLDQKVSRSSNLKCVFSSGGLLEKQVSDRAKLSLGVRPIEIFGSTETGGVAYRKQDSLEESWMMFRCVSSSLTEAGLLQVESPFIFEKTFIMSDGAELISKNKFKLLGRFDRIAKIEDKRVSLPELEKVLSLNTYVSECSVLALEVAGRQQTVAVVELSLQGREALEKGKKYQINQLLRDCLAQRFDLIVVPRRFRFVDKLPANSQGKIRYKELEKMFL